MTPVALGLAWGALIVVRLAWARPAAAGRALALAPLSPHAARAAERRVAFVASVARSLPSRARRARTVAVERDLAVVVVLISLAVSAGNNLSAALDVASAHTGGPVAGALADAVVRAGRGTRLADELEALPEQLGEAVRSFVAALVSCDRYGAALGPTLDRLALEVRTMSRQRAEAAARRLPVRLLFPLVTCILPAFALLTVAPLIAESVRGLSL